MQEPQRLSTPSRYETPEVAVRDTMKKVFGLSDGGMTDDLAFQAIREWDSLGHVRLMLALEDALQVKIDGKAAMRLTTFKAIREFVGAVAAPPTPAGEPLENATETRQESIEIHRGLRGVNFDTTRITSIDFERGEIRYRGYEIGSLLNERFEDVATLILDGQWPSVARARDVRELLADSRSGALPDRVFTVLRTARGSRPMTALAAAIAIDDTRDETGVPTPQECLELVGAMPALVAGLSCVRSGRDLPAPNPQRGIAEYLLAAIADREPTAVEVQALNACLILQADHDSNASTFACRVTAGAGGNLRASVVTGLATLSGMRHGGATETAMRMLESIGDPSEADSYVRRLHDMHMPVPGFGHAEYKIMDPRAELLEKYVMELSHEAGNTTWLEIFAAVRAAAEPYGRFGVHPNLDGYVSVIYKLLGIRAELSTGMFAVGRIAGWVAHVREQWDTNILIRPRLWYAGEAPRAFASRESSST